MGRVNAGCVLQVGGGDGVVEALGEGVGVAGGEAGGGDGVADDDLERARGEVVDVDGEQLVGADEGEGDERDAGLDGHEGAAGDGRAGGRPSGGAAAFGEDDEGEAGFEGLTPRRRLAMAVRELLESTGTWPERWRYQPMKGIFQRACLARMRNWKGSLAKRTGVSIVAEMVGGVDGDLVRCGAFLRRRR